ncbi:penicillin-binding protein [Saccharopolyspora sp. K220]|uniref:transglycosylase domain-containing protein n=1 Tax=Saccharopolyspora soli TaxID=2926618 RepID=UPI001F578FB9|nr:transglycosylase domain-containing protein [Saccharopolyspora soli]MCI2424174.1 penicillin-binding protein [Saccharopolyspora soli]
MHDASTAGRPATGKHRWLRRILWVTLSTMVGVLLVGLVAFGVGYVIWEVPEPQVVANSTQQSIVLKYSDQTEMTRIVPDTGNRTMIRDLNEVSEPMRQATLAAEDASFYRNRGFDFLGILRAVYAQLTGSPGGGSTLTQQYIKLATGNDEHSYSRKFKEIVLAVKMTNEHPKDEILKAYLNTAYYGRGAWGIHAAANAYFGKLPRDLDASEAALLAGAVQKPNDHDPRVNEVGAARRWTYVANQMLSNHMVDPAQRALMKLPVTRERFAWRGEQMSGSLFHIRERVLQELENADITTQQLHQFGGTIITTIDRNAQRVAEDSVAEVTGGQPQNLRTALVAIEPDTGSVRAYHSGGQIGGFDWAQAAQPPGPAINAFVAAAGLMQGYGIGEVYDGSSPQEIAGATYRNATGGCPDISKCSVRTAMSQSVSTAFVNMAVKFGPDKVRDAAVRAGISPVINDKPAMQRADGVVEPRIAMGDYPVSTADVAGGYATLAADGIRHETHFVQQVLSSSGSEMYSFRSKPRSAFTDNPVLSKNIAGNVTEALLGDERAAEPGTRDRQVAGVRGIAQFNGSADKAMAVWTAGYTPQIAVAVSISASDEKNQSVPVLDSDGRMLSDANPSRISAEFMTAYLANKPTENFPDVKPIGRYRDPTMPPERMPAPPVPLMSSAYRAQR